MNTIQTDHNKERTGTGSLTFRLPGQLHHKMTTKKSWKVMLSNAQLVKNHKPADRSAVATEQVLKRGTPGICI